jgi:hypothetical protein
MLAPQRGLIATDQRQKPKPRQAAAQTVPRNNTERHCLSGSYMPLTVHAHTAKMFLAPCFEFTDQTVWEREAQIALLLPATVRETKGACARIQICG